MKKDPNNYLWDKLQWSEEDLAFYHSGKSKPRVLPTNILPKNTGEKLFKKVMRMSDGFIYNSVNECIAGEKLSKSTIMRGLNKGIDYKRL
jgi:tryptophan synthase alpha subunit